MFKSVDETVGAAVWAARIFLVGLFLWLASSFAFSASPPFNPDETKPADTDVVSQYPAIERTFRDIIESWIKIDHDNVTGGHDQLTLVDQTSDPTFASGVVGIWNNAGNLSTRVAAGSVTIITATPVGSVVDYAGTTAPTGWLLTYGQCVSRTTYAALFVVLSTTYDDGCGGSDFGIPDTRGRVIAGEDDMGGVSSNRLTNQSGGLNGDTLGATGGAETHVLVDAELSSHTHGIGTLLASSGAENRHTHDVKYTTSGFDSSGGSTAVISLSSGGSTTGNDAAQNDSGSQHTHDLTGTMGTTGSDTAHNNVQATIVLVKIIKH